MSPKIAARPLKGTVSNRDDTVRYQNLTWRLPTVTKYEPSCENAMPLTLQATLLEATLNLVRQFQTLTTMSCMEPTETRRLELGADEKATHSMANLCPLNSHSWIFSRTSHTLTLGSCPL